MVESLVALGGASLFPGYEVLSQIGRGGFATVYRAREHALDRDVAIKLLDAALTEHVRERFDRECRAVGPLSNHPNIVTVHGAGITDAGHPYIVMEYMSGGSLSTRLRDMGAIPAAEAVVIGVDLLGALGAAHAAGVIHRDVKPDNILVSRYGRAQLADFGISTIPNGYQTTTGSVTATMAYAAPEVLNGERPTVASDIYAVAATLGTLVIGAPVFAQRPDETLFGYLRRIMEDAPRDIAEAGASAQFSAVLAKAMSKYPAARFASASAFADALAAVPEAADASRPLIDSVSLPAATPPVDAAPGRAESAADPTIARTVLRTSGLGVPGRLAQPSDAAQAQTAVSPAAFEASDDGRGLRADDSSLDTLLDGVTGDVQRPAWVYPPREQGWASIATSMRLVAEPDASLTERVASTDGEPTSEPSAGRRRGRLAVVVGVGVAAAAAIAGVVVATGGSDGPASPPATRHSAAPIARTAPLVAPVTSMNCAGRLCTFSASGLRTGEKVTWAFGDGTGVSTQTSTFRHGYHAPGRYSVRAVGSVGTEQVAARPLTVVVGTTPRRVRLAAGRPGSGTLSVTFAGSSGCLSGRYALQIVKGGRWHAAGTHGFRGAAGRVAAGPGKYRVVLPASTIGTAFCGAAISAPVTLKPAAVTGTAGSNGNDGTGGYDGGSYGGSSSGGSSNQPQQSAPQRDAPPLPGI